MIFENMFDSPIRSEDQERGKKKLNADLPDNDIRLSLHSVSVDSADIEDQIGTYNKLTLKKLE